VSVNIRNGFNVDIMQTFRPVLPFDWHFNEFGRGSLRERWIGIHP
jgi:hypothetical protein